MATQRLLALPSALLQKKKKPLFDLLSGDDRSIHAQAVELAAPQAITKTGTSRGDRLIGTTGNDALTGLGGNDILDGRQGRDRMTGGNGNDTYIVDNARDQVIERARGGTDLVKASVNWTLGSQVEKLTLTGTKALKGTGNSLANTITGNTGHNILDGKAGADKLIGGKGNDIYIVDNAKDQTIEKANEGIDTVRASVNHALSANVENLVLLGGALIGTGNNLDNAITGNAGNNRLDGAAGNDTLDGGVGNDTLDGGTGIDTLIGGAGDDVYVVDDAGDVVTEAEGGGTDTVQATADYTLSAHVERLVLMGSALRGTGNSLANAIAGNAGNNTLDGAAGDDTLEGGAGDDTYVVDDGGDVIVEAEGGGIDTVQATTDYALGDHIERLVLVGDALRGTGNSLDNTITGNALDNTLTGGDGNDTLDGGAGNDALVGGAGNDVYIVDSADDIVDEQGGDADFDTVRTTLRTYTLGAGIEALVMLDDSAGNFARGNELNNDITTGSSNDLLDGGAGADTMRGGNGNDTYVIDSSNDVVVELEDEGIDTVVSFITSYTLSAHTEHLTLDGSAEIGVGNALDNRLTGNANSNTLRGLDGNDTLDGGGSRDMLEGGLGDDLYILNDNDAVIEEADAGTDTIESSIDFTLPANVEVLVLTGSENIKGTGNNADNRIVGNSGDNTLDGGGGTDTLEGGNGDDTYIIDSLSDVVIDIGGTDLIQTSVDFGVFDFANLFVPTSLQRTNPLKTGIENLELIGAASVGIGNTGNNYIRGNSGSDALDGLFGRDTLDGGEGDDVLFSSQASPTLFRFSGKFGNDVIHGFNSAKGDRIDLSFLRAPGQTQVQFDVWEVANPANTSQQLFRVDVYVTNPAIGGPYTGKIYIVGANWTNEPQIMSMIWG